MIWNKVNRYNSSNESVFKYVFQSNNVIAEAVLYRYPTFEERTVICCSTQSGCPVGCRFCGAGDYFVRNLTAVEIYDQVRHLLADHTINALRIEKFQIMFMSMGEPFLNYRNLKSAIEMLNVTYPNAKLLVSTIGPNVYQWNDFIVLSKEINNIGLQFSIHESTDEKRNKLIPFKDKLSMEQLAVIGKLWKDETGRKPFINYCAHDFNTSKEDEFNLLQIFTPDIFNLTVSVICERSEHVAASNERQKSLAVNFMNNMKQYGYDVRCFDPAGQDDIGGGCGQLFHYQNWIKNHSNLAKASCGHNKEIVHN